MTCLMSCFKCGQEGHLSNECSTKCSLCGKLGHVQEVCHSKVSPLSPFDERGDVQDSPGRGVKRSKIIIKTDEMCLIS